MNAAMATVALRAYWKLETVVAPEPLALATLHEMVQFDTVLPTTNARQLAQPGFVARFVGIRNGVIPLLDPAVGDGADFHGHSIQSGLLGLAAKDRSPAFISSRIKSLLRIFARFAMRDRRA
jgi:hypothetical protein